MNSYQEKRVIEAMDNPEKLTDWENEFIDSLADKEEDYKLSTKQNAVLNRISQKMI